MGNNITLGDIRKPQILNAALTTIAKSGFQNVTLDKFAKAAGLSKGGLVHYFPTKVSLIEQAVVMFYERIFQRGREARDVHEDSLEKVLSFTWLYDREDPDLAVGYRLLFDFMALASQGEDFRKLFHDWVENWIVLLAEPIQEGVELGLFKVTDVESAARVVSAIYQGIATRWYLDRDTHSSEWAVDSLRHTVTLLLISEPVRQL